MIQEVLAAIRDWANPKFAEIGKSTDPATEPTVHGKLSALSTKVGEIDTSVATLTALDSDIKAGKEALALQITRKGRDVSATDTLLKMAEEVKGISQNPIIFEGAAEYEKQMFGTTTTTTTTPYQQDGPLWNLYKVMTDLLNDGRFAIYGGILLAEYYKGYDTIELMNVGAGGAYFTCDGDLYQEDKTGANAHVWHDGDSMANRWVAYIFAAPCTNYTIPSAELCPRSIHIGRSVGTISCSVAGRVSDIVVCDGNTLDSINFTNTQNFSKNLVIRNLKHSGLIFSEVHTSIENFILDCEDVNETINTNSYRKLLPNLLTITCQTKSISGSLLCGSSIANLKILNIPNLERLIGTVFDSGDSSSGSLAANGEMRIFAPKLISIDGGVFCKIQHVGIDRVVRINLPLLKTIENGGLLMWGRITAFSYIEEISLPKLESITDTSCLIYYTDGGVVGTTYTLGNKLKTIYLPSLVRVDDRIMIHSKNDARYPELIDVEVGEMTTNLNLRYWNPTNVLADETKKAQLLDNILHHIAAKVSDRTGQTALIFTISTNLYNNLEQATKDAFTAKNWEVRGA